jgi:hypothetical protein
MAESKRLNVLKALTTQLETISVANGYSRNMIGKVFRGRSSYGEESPEEMISILEAPRPDVAQYAAENGRARKEEWTLLVQGWCAEDQKNPSDNAYNFAQEVEECFGQIIAVSSNMGTPVFPDRYLLGNLITSFAFSPPVVRPPTEGVSSKTFFYFQVRVGLVSNLG